MATLLEFPQPSKMGTSACTPPRRVANRARRLREYLTPAEVAITTQGARLLFLPPYSPDLNPIERDFATLKKRREYQTDQSLDDLIKNLGLA